MRKLKRLNEAPPDGFKYVHPETGHSTVAIDPVTWLQKAKEHRVANGLPIPDDLFLQMQNQLCMTLPPELWEIDRGDSTWVDTHLTGADVYNASQVYLEWRKQGKPFVSPEEAERRASICAGCYLNVRILGCGGWCNKIVELIINTKGERKTSYDAQLQNCAVCKCNNSSQVHFPMELLELSDSPERQNKYPIEFCWKRKDGVNYRNDLQTQ